MEIDILINYSETDNKAENGNDGWVSSFEKFLQTILSQVLGANPVIVSKSDADSLTKTELKNTGVLVSIISNEMVKSGPCLDAIEEFYAGKKSDAKVLKVMKEHVSVELLPAKLNQLIPYELYNAESDDKNAFYDFFGPNAESIYWMKLVDLAFDINELLYEQENNVKNIKPLFDRKSIYLAVTGNDLSIQRNIIRRELQRHGFKVLPNHNLSPKLDDLTKEINKNLEECVFGIHLLGNSYGDIPEGSDRSVVDLQNKLASQIKTKDGGKMQRLIWIKPDQTKSSDKQKVFLENLQRDATALEGAEVLQTPLEDFKNIMREEMFVNDSFGVPQEETFHVDKKKLNVYLIYDKIDKNSVSSIIKLLVKEGLNVIEPDFGNDLLEVRKGHLEKLKQLDLAIVFQEKVNMNWVRMKLLDLLKAPGLGRNKPIVGKAILAGEGIELSKEGFVDYEVDLIEFKNKKSTEDAIIAFIKGLNKAI
ncbi:MAG: DUF4062 domain-containing protein [Cyclobacteriaceae bacterium]|nr:DUF4062 domain-containing protein [Cyclobacteriaceae bacterium]